MNYSYPMTMYESIFTQMYAFLAEKYYLQFSLNKYFMVGDLTSSVRRKYLWILISFSYIVVRNLFKLTLLYKIHPACRNDANGIKPGSYSKMTDKHAAEYSKTACFWHKLIYVHKLLIQRYSQKYILAILSRRLILLAIFEIVKLLSYKVISSIPEQLGYINPYKPGVPFIGHMQT